MWWGSIRYLFVDVDNNDVLFALQLNYPTPHYSKDVRLPVQLQRAMAAEAEAAREARAKVIAAEGEQKASRALREASEVIGDSPAALQLRYLQTLNTISAEKNSTIVFPLPIDILTYFMKSKEAFVPNA